MKSLPDYFKKYFWDCKFEELEPAKHKNFILGRILFYGDLQAIKFILNNFSKSEVENYLKIKGEQSLDKRSRNFWSKLVNESNLWKYEVPL